jgi:hypothetical protein
VVAFLVAFGAFTEKNCHLFYFWLPLPTLINPTFDYCLHQFSFWCKFYLIGAFIAKFCHLFYFWFSSITIVFIIFVNILQPLELVAFLVLTGCILNIYLE